MELNIEGSAPGIRPEGYTLVAGQNAPSSRAVLLPFRPLAARLRRAAGRGGGAHHGARRPAAWRPCLQAALPQQHAAPDASFAT